MDIKQYLSIIGVVDEQTIPYQNVVPSDPSFDDMQKVVCDGRIRPQIPTRWVQDDVSTI